MSAAQVRLRDVAAVAVALERAVRSFGPVLTAEGPAWFTLPEPLARHAATTLLMDLGPGVATAFRHAVRAPLRIEREAPAWWVLSCRLCGHEEPAPRWVEAMGLAHVHRLECIAGMMLDWEHEPCGGGTP